MLEKFLPSAKYILVLSSCLFAYNCAEGVRTVKAPVNFPSAQFNNSLNASVEAELSLAHYCKTTGFEDAAIVTDRGDIIDVGINPQNVYEKDELIQQGIRVDGSKFMEAVVSSNNFTLYHCHFQQNPDTPTHPIPSSSDVANSLIFLHEFLVYQPDGILKFKIVTPGSDNSANVTEYYLKNDELLTIKKFADTSRQYGTLREVAEPAIMNDKKLEEYVGSLVRNYANTLRIDERRPWQSPIMQSAYEKMGAKVPKGMAINLSMLQFANENSPIGLNIYNTPNQK